MNKLKPFFEAKERELKRAKLDSTGSFHVQAQAITEVSYALSYRIARDKKPPTIGETLVKPCLLECTKIILGDTAAQKIADLSLSDSTVKSRIDDMSAEIKRQVIEKIKSSPISPFNLMSLLMLLAFHSWWCLHAMYTEKQLRKNFCSAVL
ncbi:protein FAM200C-like [Watersipora subatra]|uniref:protein FAM200C-like n=1 Tax=Watersipora subatra TaxID=2589382 RepID=UPI00355BD9E6